VIAAVGQVKGFVGTHLNSVRLLEKIMPPARDDCPVWIEDDHRIRSAIENVGVVVLINADPAHVTDAGQNNPFAPCVVNFIVHFRLRAHAFHWFSSSAGSPAAFHTHEALTIAQ
jgi:hypothetical protein